MSFNPASSSLAKLSPPENRIAGTITIPASKSFSNRALITAALASGRSLIRGASPSEDTVALINALRVLGISIEMRSDGSLIVDGGSERIIEGERVIDVGPAGTTMRFLLSLLAATRSGKTVLRGSERMHQRPIGELVNALRELGAEISYLGTEGCPPVEIRGKALAGGAASIPGTTSSQFISSLLLAAPCFSDGLNLKVRGGLVSSSYVGTTLDVMERFGVTVTVTDEPHGYHIPAGGHYHPLSYQPEGDATGATYWWGIAAISGGSVTVRNISRTSRQGDLAILDILSGMGCTITSSTDTSQGSHEAAENSDSMPWVKVTGPARLRATNADMTLLPDSGQTMAIVAACAAGTSLLTGLETLSKKESDRIGDTIRELASVGISATGSAHSMTIIGGTPTPSRSIATYHDHRMAMAFAMLAATSPGIAISDPKVTGKSYPDFWRDLSSLGIGVSFGE